MKIYYKHIDFNVDYPIDDFLEIDRNIINRIINKDAKYRKIAGYYLFYSVLGEYRNKVKISEHGKPYLEGEKIYFNISHSFSIATMAVSELNLGLDIEKIRPFDLRLINRGICESDRDKLLSSKENYSLFYKYWTAKESIIKYDGRGFGIDLKSINVTKILSEQEKKNNNLKKINDTPILQHFYLNDYIGCVYSKDMEIELIEIL